MSFQWASFNNIFMIKNVEINGVQYFDDSSLASYKNDIKDNHIMFFDLKSYKDDIESLAYVKDCKISRIFPGTINIFIYEREPLALINSTDLIMLDIDGICLPVEEYENISLPILSNFKTNEIYNISDDKPSSSEEVTLYGAKILDINKLITIESMDIESEMLKNFYKDSKKVSNKKMKSFFNYDLKFPTYIEGLNNIRNNLI